MEYANFFNDENCCFSIAIEERENNSNTNKSEVMPEFQPKFSDPLFQQSCFFTLPVSSSHNFVLFYALSGE